MEKNKILAFIAAVAFTLSPRIAMADAGEHAQPILGASAIKIANSGAHPAQPRDHDRKSNALPAKQIEKILQAKGSVSDGVLTIDQSRGDLYKLNITAIASRVPFKEGFELTNEFHFQLAPGGRGAAIMNADIPLRPSATLAFIDKLLANGLVFQAFHQHYYDLRPMIFFIHFRAIGDPIRIAHAVAQAISVTGTPLPQMQSSSDSATPLDKHKLEKILHGDAQVSSNGVVIVTIPRRDHLTLGGTAVKTELGLETEVQFEPLGNGKTAVSPDFAMTASEIQPIIKIMRKQGFVIGCLYNQETGEQPQLYFSHQLKVGNAYDLAREVRKGLDKSDSKGSPPTGG